MRYVRGSGVKEVIVGGDAGVAVDGAGRGVLVGAGGTGAAGGAGATGGAGTTGGGAGT